MNLVSIRGAITVDHNEADSIAENTKILLEEIIRRNQLNKGDVLSILFSSTKDLNEAYPAVTARQLGFLNCGLMCFQEMHVKDSLTKCIRVLILADIEVKQSEVKHVYLKNAIKLRPDLK